MTNQTSLRIKFFEQLQTLITAGFGFVAALAWNEAIQSMFSKFFPQQSGMLMKFFYAIIITAIAVVVTARISNIINKLKGETQK